MMCSLSQKSRLQMEGKNNRRGWVHKFYVLGKVNSNIDQQINLTMSSRPQECLIPRRISQRVRLKQLRNLDEFKIPNPYRSHRNPALPDALLKQLKKMTHLSSTSINLISLPLAPCNQNHSELYLIKMAQAHQEQEAKYQSVFGPTMLDENQLDNDYCSRSEAHPTHPSQGLDIVQARDDLEMHIYEDRSNLQENLFDWQAGAKEETSKMQEQHWLQPQEVNQSISVEDYEKYFTA